MFGARPRAQFSLSLSLSLPLSGPKEQLGAQRSVPVGGEEQAHEHVHRLALASCFRRPPLARAASTTATAGADYIHCTGLEMSNLITRPAVSPRGTLRPRQWLLFCGPGPRGELVPATGRGHNSATRSRLPELIRADSIPSNRIGSPSGRVAFDWLRRAAGSREERGGSWAQSR